MEKKEGFTKSRESKIHLTAPFKGVKGGLGRGKYGT